MVHSRPRSRSPHFKFLEQRNHPVSGMALENNGSIEHKGFGSIAWIVVAIIILLTALIAHGMAVAINP
jgi:hypothetical protein